MPKLVAAARDAPPSLRGPQASISQSAHFGTTGSDFALVKRLQVVGAPALSLRLRVMGCPQTFIK